MSDEIKKNNNGFVEFLENLLLAKSVRHGFLLYFIIFNLDLILTLLGKGHIVKDLARIIPGIFFGTIETSLIENCVYKGSIYNADVSIWWRFGKPLLFGFGVPIGFDVIQRGSIKTRELIERKIDISSLSLENEKHLKKEIIRLNTIIKKHGDLFFNQAKHCINITHQLKLVDKINIQNDDGSNIDIRLNEIKSVNMNNAIKSIIDTLNKPHHNLHDNEVNAQYKLILPFLQSIKDYPFKTTHP